MDEQQSRIQDDLRGLLAGEVHCDDLFLALYASDASIYQIRPRAVVMPRSAADVAACVRYAWESNLPIHARGAGTGLAGESLGPGIVLDFSRHLRRIIATDDETVRVQPGVVLERLNTHLRAKGRHFGPDPAMSHVTTMGSVVAIDYGGSHWLKYGSARRHVRSVQAVLANGDTLEFGREAVPSQQTPVADERRREMVGQLAALIGNHRELIAQKQPLDLPNCSGYNLAGVLSNGHLDVAKLLTGSEGTLALFTEITFDTQPLPGHRGLAMLLFDRLEYAARAVQELLPLKPVACDLMDRRHLSLAREAEPRYDVLIPIETEALLLVEHEGANLPEVRDRVRQSIELVRRKKRLAFDARQVTRTRSIYSGSSPGA